MQVVLTSRVLRRAPSTTMQHTPCLLALGTCSHKLVCHIALAAEHLQTPLADSDPTHTRCCLPPTPQVLL